MINSSGVSPIPWHGKILIDIILGINLVTGLDSLYLAELTYLSVNGDNKGTIGLDRGFTAGMPNELFMYGVDVVRTGENVMETISP